MTRVDASWRRRRDATAAKASSGDGSGGTGVEARLSDVFASYAGRRTSRPGHVLRHALTIAWALGALSALPRVEVGPGPGLEGDAVRAGLTVPEGERLLLRGARSALAVPESPGDYELGASKQTLRRKVRQAEGAGITWRRIDDPEERARFVAVADAHERSHPMARYRNTEPHNADLLPFRLWLGAFDRHGDPVMLAVLPHDGEWAVLRHFRQLQDTPEASAARYLMTKAAVEQLSVAGVRWLFDEASPQWLDNGLRHFQRMVGYRLVRARLHPPHRT